MFSYVLLQRLRNFVAIFAKFFIQQKSAVQTMRRMIECDIGQFTIELFKKLRDTLLPELMCGEVKMKNLKSETPPKRGQSKRATLGDVLVIQN